MTLVSYIDESWVGRNDDRRSTSGANVFLGDCLVSWSSKKQSSISLSTSEVEYITTTSCCTQIIWMKKTMENI